jgi:O-antigen/teichoic acid export membrane protein
MKINYKSFSHFFTLSFGSILSLGINISVLILFSRIYSKENFGDYAIFVSVISIFSIAATFRIEHLIVLKKTIKEAAFLAKICNKIIAYFTLVTFFISVVFYLFSFSFFNLPSFVWLFIAIPIYCLSHIIVFLSLNNKIKDYKLISNYKILQSLTFGFTGFLCNYYDKNFGLIIAYVLGLVASFLLFSIYDKKFTQKFHFSLVNFKDIKSTFYSNSSYIKISFGLEFFNTISKYIPNFILNAYYGNGIVGIYDMTLKVLNIPKNIISLNIGELYYQKAAIFYHKSKQKFSKITAQTFYILLLTSVLCYTPFIFFGEELFVFALGNQWKLSGELSEIIALWFIFLFITSPMAYIFYIRQTLNQLFWFTFLTFLVKTAFLFYLATTNLETQIIYNYTYVCIVLELVLIYQIKRNYKRKFFKKQGTHFH